MKKFISLIVASILSIIAIFSLTACGSAKAEEVKCAPCTVQEVWAFNEDAIKAMPYGRLATSGVNVVVVIDGTESWMRDILHIELTEGKHTIKFYTKDTIVKYYSPSDGGHAYLPYDRSVTIKVNVSTDHPDIYDVRYRIENGLYAREQTADFWEDAVAKDQEKLENLYQLSKQA